MKIALGSWWASFCESYYNEMKLGVMPSELNVWKFAKEAWDFHEMERYKNDPAWLKVYDKFGGEAGARIMAMEYHLAFGAQHFNDWQVLGPEMGFGWSEEVLLGEDDKVVVYYGGKPDLTQLVRSQNMIIPTDYKTKDYIPSDALLQYKPHPQTAGYIYAIRHLMNSAQALGKAKFPNTFPPTKCIVFVCARFKVEKPRNGVTKPRFVPVFVEYSDSELEEWRLSVIEKCRRLRDNIERDYFPPRESQCHVYTGGCPFRRVCSAPPNIREQVLNADFIKAEPWIPYKAEED
jgi:hypothetical protein